MENKNFLIGRGGGFSVLTHQGFAEKRKQVRTTTTPEVTITIEVQKFHVSMSIRSNGLGVRNIKENFVYLLSKQPENRKEYVIIIYQDISNDFHAMKVQAFKMDKCEPHFLEKVILSFQVNEMMLALKNKRGKGKRGKAIYCEYGKIEMLPGPGERQITQGIWVYMPGTDQVRNFCKRNRHVTPQKIVQVAVVKINNNNNSHQSSKRCLLKELAMVMMNFPMNQILNFKWHRKKSKNLKNWK